MAALSRFDPFTSSIDDLFRGLLVRPTRLGLDLESMMGQQLQQLQMKIDVKKSDGAYEVTAELPGVKKEDIQVNVDGNLITISAEVKREQEDKQGEQVLRSERYYGRIERTFALDSEIDESKVEAKYEDGLLKLHLPTKAASSAKRIAVS